MIWMGFADTSRPEGPLDAGQSKEKTSPSMFTNLTDDNLDDADSTQDAAENPQALSNDSDLDIETEAQEQEPDDVDEEMSSAAAEIEEEHEDHDEQTVAGEINDTLAKLVPWAISFLAHLGLVLLAIFIVWSVSNVIEDEEQIIPLVNLSETPGVPLQVQVQDRVETSSSSPSPTPSTSDTPSPTESEISVDMALPGIGDPVGGAPSFGLTVGDAAAFDTTFLGSGGNARNVVFLVDASGSLVDTLPFVILELKKTIRELDEKQRFAILFFQADRVLEVPPGRLTAATADAKARAIQWIDPSSNNVTTAGSGDPVAAVTKALQMKPDLLFLLSDNIIGRGKYAVDQKRLIDSIERANRGKTAINTIQFLYPDPLELTNGKGTLELIAQNTGGIYTFVDAATLGID